MGRLGELISSEHMAQAALIAYKPSSLAETEQWRVVAVRAPPEVPFIADGACKAVTLGSKQHCEADWADGVGVRRASEMVNTQFKPDSHCPLLGTGRDAVVGERVVRQRWVTVWSGGAGRDLWTLDPPTGDVVVSAEALRSEPMRLGPQAGVAFPVSGWRGRRVSGQ